VKSHCLLIFSLLTALILLEGCAEKERVKFVETEEGTYIIDKKSGKFYKYDD